MQTIFINLFDTKQEKQANIKKKKLSLLPNPSTLRYECLSFFFSTCQRSSFPLHFLQNCLCADWASFWHGVKDHVIAVARLLVIREQSGKLIPLTLQRSRHCVFDSIPDVILTLSDESRQMCLIDHALKRHGI